jgi:2-(1,2-epoxy-1,2-dihydrophenyl)acetyl-CoA isomerase
MEYKTIITTREEHIGTLTLNRPDKLNALNDQMAVELIKAMTDFLQDTETRVIVITGAGRAFSAGADLQETLLKPALEKKPSRVMRGWPEEMCSLFRRTNKPIIASINGAAVGFGCTVCLSSDIRIAARSAKMGLGFVRIGVLPGDGATYYLPRLVGFGKACELAFTSRIIDADEARDIGMVNQVVADDKLKAVTYEMAKTLIEAPPIALQWAKQALYQSLEGSFSSQLRLETAGQKACFASEDFIEAIQSFLEKRKPVYTDG